MGFFDRLFWGTSKRAANDVSRGVIKEKMIKDKSSLQQKIDLHNHTSEHIHERRGAIEDCISFINEQLNNVMDSGEADVEAWLKWEEEHYERLLFCYEKVVLPLNEPLTLPLNDKVRELYLEGLEAYNQAVEDFTVYVFRRMKWKKRKDYLNLGIPERKKDKRNIFELQNSIVQHYDVFYEIGEQVLNRVTTVR